MSRVFEEGGVWAGLGEKTGWISIHEREKGIDISTGGFHTFQMHPLVARRLANQLYRFAKRVEKENS